MVKLKKWNDYQQSTAAKGGGPWRKIWKSMPSDYHVKKLTPEQRWQLVCMITVADNEGVVNKSPEEMADICSTDSFDYRDFGDFVEFEMGQEPLKIISRDFEEFEKISKDSKEFEILSKDSEGFEKISKDFELLKTPHDPKKTAMPIRVDQTRLDKNILDKTREKKRDDGLFKTFWNMYPKHRRRSKPQAEKKFYALIDQGVVPGDIIGGLDRAIDSRDWQKDGGRYIPAPMPFLNHHQFECAWESSGTDESETHDERTEGSL